VKVAVEVPALPSATVTSPIEMSPTTAATGLLLALTVSNAGSLWSNSLQQGTVASSLQFNARLQGNLQNAASVSDPVVLIRVAGSQNQSIDCDPALSNLRDEITGGCSPKYTRNTTGTCPAYSALWSTAQPWSCVKVQTGGAVGQVSQGMTDRILQGGSCAQHPNNWSLFPNFPTGDTRIVPVFVTPSGSFQGSGNDIFPVTDFAMFYVTGWGGNGNSAQCAGDDPVPDKGYIAGHFIKYLDTLGDGDTTQVCDPSGLTPCVPIMTR